MPPKKKKTKSATLADVQDIPEFPVGEESDGDSCGSASSLDSMMVFSTKYLHFTSDPVTVRGVGLLMCRKCKSTLRRG